MNSYELKKAAIDKLRATTGKKLPSTAVMLDICRAIGRHPKGGLTPAQILRDYVGIKNEAPTNAVAAPYRPTFREMESRPHPRMADIQRAQPPMMTPTGTGNWNQYSQYMLDNGRSR
ncbi:hypothetical protein [Pusillimonas noertemannii]|uniref:Uncharacterized protein n=1 Tax=Pusillimonas noertemannii TaxID=305977 RepID=A0A2U1CS49_9BURK|nr:hypothetical protein [Pusillimonas noertemannii]NYT67958.1 hypothetical protein [Pusillimonas noertemannii]PVY68631.1 hypothetical protein C7440_1042 [Pusillimonas noertemannii]TFL11901.1 hypothetical protein CSC72_01865 [Pusillimonas noertemannii]